MYCPDGAGKSLRMDIRYITVREFSGFHEVETRLVNSFLEFGIVECHYQNEEPCIAETDIEDIEAALRLHLELEVNLEGIDIILHMRRQLLNLQQRLSALDSQ
jgi:chaperone modulatory protein CbpM